MNGTGIVLVLALLGNLHLTAYRSVPEQTDSTPFETSTGEHVSKYGCAISQDLLCPLAHGKHKLHDKHKCPYQYSHLHYGDWLFIPGYGLRAVNDCTHARLKKHVDLWVKTYNEEKQVGVRTTDVFVLKQL